MTFGDIPGCNCNHICCERDIYDAEPVHCPPCWDNCKCMEEILQNARDIKEFQSRLDKLKSKLEGRIIKVEEDLIKINANLSQQIFELAEKEDTDVAALNSRVDQEIADRIADVDAEEERARHKESIIEAALLAEKTRAQREEGIIADNLAAEVQRATGEEARIDGELANEAERSITDAVYNPQTKKIYFYNKDHVMKAEINTDDFVIDGMVRHVEIIDGALEIQWNTDGTEATGHAYTRIPLTDIFNPNNYYSAAWIDEHIILHRIEPLEEKVNQHTMDYNSVLQYGAPVAIAKVNNVEITAQLPVRPTSVTTATEDSQGNNIYDTYVSNITTNGNNVVWTKAGTDNNLTVPYATKASQDFNGDTIHTTYLKKNEASSTYLTQANAASTYLTQTDASSTYSTKSHTIKDITLDGNYLKLWFDDGNFGTCALPAGLVNVNTLSSAVNDLSNRIVALESMWNADAVTNTLSPKSPYANVSMSGNLTVGGTADITGNTTVTGSVTGAGFYDSLIS